MNEYNPKKCSSGGIISYSNGEIKCSLHSDDGNNEEEEEVPFL